MHIFSVILGKLSPVQSLQLKRVGKKTKTTFSLVSECGNTSFVLLGYSYNKTVFIAAFQLRLPH